MQYKNMSIAKCLYVRIRFAESPECTVHTPIRQDTLPIFLCRLTLMVCKNRFEFVFYRRIDLNSDNEQCLEILRAHSFHSNELGLIYGHTYIIQTYMCTSIDVTTIDKFNEKKRLFTSPVICITSTSTMANPSLSHIHNDFHIIFCIGSNAQFPNRRLFPIY